MSTNTYKNILLLGSAGDTVIKVDYSDNDALTKALVDQDVLISTVGGEDLFNDFEIILVEAAIDAGVKWFIPSEFGADYDDPICTTIPVLFSKLAVAKLLRKNQSRITHTFITAGMFLDWSFDNEFLGFDIPNRTVTLYNEGKAYISGTTLPNIAKAVVAAIHHPEVSSNKRIYITDATFTQQEALALFEKYTNTKWTIKHVSTKDKQKEGAENFTKGSFGQALLDYIRYLVHSGLKVNMLEGRTSKKDLGIPTVSLDQIVKEVVQRTNPAQ